MVRVDRLALLLLVAACGESGHSLDVDLRTDFVPGEEFVSIETTLDGRPTQDEPATALDDFRSGGRVASFDGLARGPTRVVVVLRDAAGAAIAERLIRLTLENDSGILVVVSRLCMGGVCPTCVLDADCEGVAVPACAVPVCAEGTCLLAALDELCPPGARCHPVDGCSAESDAGPPPACRGDSDCPDDEVVRSGCLPAGTDCSTMGADEVRTTRWECVAGTCQSTVDMDVIPCTVDTEGVPCEECHTCQGGACLPFDGTLCFRSAVAGLCWAGACCIGCWNGSVCQMGLSDSSCGEAGEACQDCTSSGRTCSPLFVGGYCR